MECRNKGDKNNNKGNWYLSKIIEKIPEQHAGKARNQGTTENSHIGQCAHAWEGINIEVRKICEITLNVS